ncbi:LacI family transcriptional regulator [Pedobacter psychrophilus]|uniref:LacI family transcriptional regulator n=1 Tax=Pedobacter psychrophilus TaxID=1826909 RepID=A0A179DAT2_9SPHI|nr:LacI family DNA-binding transcriptional regulator [Pedobacter psychrophilus]OAQ38024.1 LacI family transcriptional regulator [Pedobacter psychrophilus]
MKHFITIKDIAKELDISVSTVSRALRDTYDVNKETREKVLEMAIKLKYKPNFNATGLAKGSSHNIAVILPFITNYYFSTVITGIQEVAYQSGYNIVLYVTNDSPEREIDIISNLPITSLDGLLVSIASNSDYFDHFVEVMANEIPIVFFDRVANNLETSKVLQDDYNGAFEGVEHLIENGYKKIAHIAGPDTLTFTQNRLRGYLDALHKHQLSTKEEWIVHSGFSQEDGKKDAELLMSLADRPDSIFAANDRKAIGAILYLKSKGIKVGEEMGVVGFTNDPSSEIISPALTTIAEPAFEIGKKSCELLLKHIERKNFHPQEIVFPGKLIVRESSSKTI